MLPVHFEKDLHRCRVNRWLLSSNESFLLSTILVALLELPLLLELRDGDLFRSEGENVDDAVVVGLEMDPGVVGLEMDVVEILLVLAVFMLFEPGLFDKDDIFTVTPVAVVAIPVAVVATSDIIVFIFLKSSSCCWSMEYIESLRNESNFDPCIILW